MQQTFQIVIDVPNRCDDFCPEDIENKLLDLGLGRMAEIISVKEIE